MSHALVQAMLKTFKPELDVKSGEVGSGRAGEWAGG
jgi:hypothetical protein